MRRLAGTARTRRRPAAALVCALSVVIAGGLAPIARAQGTWEVTPQGERASELGLEWLAANQGPTGNWGTNDVGLVALGVLAFLSAGHMPDRGPYGENVRRGLDFIVASAKPSGLLNISNERRDMYNHGLATFVLTQAYGMSEDPELGKTLDRALQLISDVQCDDGGWDYVAKRQPKGHDLSLAVMQAKALRGAMDVGMEVPPRTIEKAIQSVRDHYKVTGGPDGKGDKYGDDPLAKRPGVFTYDGNKITVAMAAAGPVCLQEFGEYEDFRIYRSLDYVGREIDKQKRHWKRRDGRVPFDAYTLYYVGQALYQAGGERWRDHYPALRDGLVARQRIGGDRRTAGSWEAGAHVGGKTSLLFGTSAAVFVLNIPNRYLPILQQGNLEGASGAEAQGTAGAAEAGDGGTP